MRLSLIVLWLLSISSVVAQDTIRVRAFDRATIVTDPMAGVRSYPVRVSFPAREVPVRKVMLSLTFGCPDGMRCADWDYLDHVLVHAVNSTDTFEVARMLTPYGGMFGKEWRFTWRSDVTDFSPVLRDSVEVIYVHSGYEPNEDRGWSLTLDFDFVQGPPAAEVISVQQLYRGSFAYGSKQRSVEADLVSRTISTDPRTALLRVRTHQTGHGMNEGDGCGEFCRKWRSIKVDKREVSRRWLWKDCGSNALWPQAGTWIYDRADWCPGELYEADAVTAPVKPGIAEHVVDIDMEPYKPDSSTARTSIAAYAIQLAKPRAEFDAAIEEILLPNDDPRFSRMNPAVHEPQVVVRNMGNQAIDLVMLEYGTEGFPKRRHIHSKRLRFGEADTVMLPHLVDMKPGLNTFVVKLSKPGGKKDGWMGDNVMRSTFTAADVLDSIIVVQLRTNAQPEQNGFRVTNTKGHAFIDRPLGSLKADSLYTDTLRLPAAGYVMQLADTAGDGLEFWHNAAGGRGFLRLLDEHGRLLKSFVSDCGDGITYQFLAGAEPTVMPSDASMIGLFPTRTMGKTALDYFANDGAPIDMELRDEQGALAWSESIATAPREFQRRFDFSSLPRGRYTFKLMREGKEVFSTRLRLLESLD